MKKLIAAVQFSTILPTFGESVFEPRGMIQFFPVVGLILGLMTALFDALAMQFWPAHVVAVMDVVFMAGVTGAFHLDGLGDAADGLLAHHEKERALAIMKDSRVGAMGLVAVVCALAVKWGGIASIESHRFLLILIIPAYARGSQVFGFRFLEYGRPGGGTGHPLFGHKTRNRDFWALLIPFSFSLFLGWKCLLLNISFIMIVALTLFYYKRRLGCITGDMLGAMTEITEASLFLLVAAGGAA